MVRPRLSFVHLALAGLLAGGLWFAAQLRTPSPALLEEQETLADVLEVTTSTSSNLRTDTTSSITTARVRLPDGGEAVLALRQGSRPVQGARISVRVQAYSDGSRRVTEAATLY